MGNNSHPFSPINTNRERSKEGRNIEKEEREGMKNRENREERTEKKTDMRNENKIEQKKKTLKKKNRQLAQQLIAQPPRLEETLAAPPYPAAPPSSEIEEEKTEIERGSHAGSKKEGESPSATITVHCDNSVTATSAARSVSSSSSSLVALHCSASE